MTSLEAAFANIECELGLDKEDIDMRDYNTAIRNDYVGNPASASPFDRLSDVVSQLISAGGEVDRIADRIAGPVPSVSEGGALKEANVGGLIDSMEKSTRDIDAVVSRLLSSVKRIENRL